MIRLLNRDRILKYGVVVSLILFAAMVVGGLFTFIRNPFDTERNKILDKYNEVLAQPTREQEQEAYLKLPLDQQVDMYILVMTTEVPRARFGETLASNGSKVVPFLLARLRAETIDHRKMLLVDILKIIHFKYYKLNQSSEVLETLQNTCASIKDSNERFVCETFLKSLSR